MMPLVPLTVRLPFVGSYFVAVRGLAGLFSAGRDGGERLFRRQIRAINTLLVSAVVSIFWVAEAGL